MTVAARSRGNLRSLASALLAAALVIGSTIPALAETRSMEDVLGAVFAIRTAIPATARTADTLGTEREGNAVLINGNGLILTIGYLILEAEKAIVINSDGDEIETTFVAYDHASGFGLVRAKKPLSAKPLPLGSSDGLTQRSKVLAVSAAGPRRVSPAVVVSRREFAGYWEYLLDNAIFTRPYHNSYGGAALIDGDGTLVGIGSLFVNDAEVPGEVGPGNMFVPIDLLKPILADLVEKGRASRPARPWIGAYADQANGRVFVRRVARDGPAEKAGIKPGDIIMGVGGRCVGAMSEFYRRMWATGGAGATISIDVLPISQEDLDIKRIEVRSIDRHEWLVLDKF